MIYYRTIWDTEKNFGGCINREMELIPNSDDWVVWMDGDVMFLTELWGKQIEDIISAHGNEYSLFGSKLSRCNVYHQLVNGICSNDDTIEYHYLLAHDLAAGWYDKITTTKGPIAAACMFFQKKTWENIKFVEDTPYFDIIFSAQVRKNKMKMAVCEGLYLLHKYRLGSKDPGRDDKHLMK